MRSEEEKKKIRKQSLESLKRDFLQGKKPTENKSSNKFGAGKFGR